MFLMSHIPFAEPAVAVEPLSSGDAGFPGAISWMLDPGSAWQSQGCARA